jgi:hypothetical protein
MTSLLIWLVIIIVAIVCIVIGFTIAAEIIKRTYKINPQDTAVASSLVMGCYSLIFGVPSGLALFGVLYWLFGAWLWSL